MVFAPWTMEKITQQWPRGPGQPAEETEEYYKRLCQNMAAMTQLNAWTDIDKIIKAHLASPCRRQKILAHLRSVYRLDDDASLTILGLDAKLEAAGEPTQQCVTMAFFNFKGGVGKTTMTINTAAALAKR